VTAARTRIPTVVTVAAAVGLLFYGRIPQFADYHTFADPRVVDGIPHGADVLSNIGFAIVGAWGVLQLTGSKRTRSAKCSGDGAYLVFACALILTAAGSAYYHLAPDNSRLIWDRIPIALGCAGLLAFVRADLRPVAQARTFLALLIAAGVFSVMWWQWTDARGADDLRPYLLLQGLPLVLVPLWQWIYGASRRERLLFAAAALLYLAAKVAELNDQAIYVAFGWIGGHALKHLLATVAAAAIVAMRTDVGRSRRADPTPMALA
jgi:predicted membrane channel-forming protein YqfA (hemolysin III family)